MIGLTKLSLKRPVSVCIIVLALILFGTSAVFSSPLELTPDMEMPMLVVATVYPGAAPQDVENLVTSKIEDAVSTLSGVKNVQATSMENMSMVILEMEYGTDMTEAHDNLKNNLDLYANSLPDDAKKPAIIEMNVDMMPTITLSAQARGDVDLLYYVDEVISPEFEKLGGVASVDVSGGNKDYISVELQEDRLVQYGLTMDSVAKVLSTADFSMPAGSVGQGELDLTLRGGVSYDTVEGLKALPITLSTGDVIHLSDLANVHEATEKASSLSRYNGDENVGINIKKRQSASTFAVTNSVKSTLEQLNASGNGVELNVVYDSSEEILSAITSVVQTLVYGVILAMLVLFLFFGDWRASLIVGSSIPLSLLVTLIAMNFMGFSYNIISLGGLVIGVGMMVDNSIVVLESCFRLKERGKGRNPREAALEGTRVVASSIFASTLTTVVVFLPIAFIKGMVGQLFGQLCFTIVFSLIASLISSMTLVPLVFLKLSPQEKQHKAVKVTMQRLEDGYAKLLPRILRHKRLAVFAAVALLIGSFAIVPLIGVELIPETDEGVIQINVNTRPGLKLEKLDEKLRPLEEMVASNPDVDHYSMTAGGSGIGSMMGSSDANATITAYLKSDRKTPTVQVVDQWREATSGILDCDVSVSASSTTATMSGGTDVQINLQGTDMDSLEEAARQVEGMMRAREDILRVSSTVTSGKPQAEIVVDPVRSGAVGLVPMQVMGSVYKMMEGTEAFELHRDNRDYSVKVEYPEDRFASVSDLAGMSVMSPSGMLVPLLDIADIKYSNSPQSISSKNGLYLVTVTGQPASWAPKGMNAEVSELVKKMDLPDGVSVTQSDMLERQEEEFSSIYHAIATAVFLVFMVMAMQFESPRFSIVVMLCVPFALIGSFGALLVTRCTLSMPSLMGFLMLIGIVVNNGILFIDTANRLRREEGLSIVDALVSSGKLRMRPIFMTTLTTVIAMAPMALGTGSNGELMQGMALVIIGGLIASTTLTLLLLPTFYVLADKRQKKKKKEEPKQLEASTRTV